MYRVLKGYCARRGCDLQGIAGGTAFEEDVMYRELQGDTALGECVMYRVLLGLLR